MSVIVFSSICVSFLFFSQSLPSLSCRVTVFSPLPLLVMKFTTEIVYFSLKMRLGRNVAPLIVW